MQKFAFASLLVIVLASCAANDDSRINPSLMTDEQIVAYNRTQDRIWDQIHCVRETHTRSHIKKRYCATLSELNQRMRDTGEQLNIISFGTPQIWH